MYGNYDSSNLRLMWTFERNSLMCIWFACVHSYPERSSNTPCLPLSLGHPSVSTLALRPPVQALPSTRPPRSAAPSGSISTYRQSDSQIGIIGKKEGRERERERREMPKCCLFFFIYSPSPPNSALHFHFPSLSKEKKLRAHFHCPYISIIVGREGHKAKGTTTQSK